METEIRLLPNNCYPIGKDNLVEIEIKQNKEDMEEKKLNLKSFDIQKAREGKPVCTRDGLKARIICFDRKDIKPIVALVTFIDGTSVIEKAFYYFEDGYHLSKNDKNNYDLMMLPEKKRDGLMCIKVDCLIQNLILLKKKPLIRRAQKVMLIRLR